MLSRLTRVTVENVVGNIHDVFRLPLEAMEELQLQLMRDKFRFHYENSRFYHKLCTGRQVTPDDLATYEDLDKIPLIPVRYFKQPEAHLLLTLPLREIEFEMRSTGTGGIPSVSRRDRRTVDISLQFLAGLYREFFGFSRGAGLMLCPSTDEMPEMGMVKVLNILRGMFDASEYLVRRASFKPEQAIEFLNRWEGIHTRHIVGPPFLINRFLQYLADNNTPLQLDRGSRIITIGGWKRFTAEKISRELFNERCATYLGIQPNRVADVYGLVEANMLAIECEMGNKHIPPWVYAGLRDPQNLEAPAKPGKPGALVIMDPTSYAYPCFLQTEDVVQLRKAEPCGCGRSGTYLDFVERLPGAELGCCAVNLERFMDEADASESSR